MAATGAVEGWIPAFAGMTTRKCWGMMGESLVRYARSRSHAAVSRADPIAQRRRSQRSYGPCIYFLLILPSYNARAGCGRNVVTVRCLHLMKLEQVPSTGFRPVLQGCIKAQVLGSEKVTRSQRKTDGASQPQAETVAQKSGARQWQGFRPSMQFGRNGRPKR
jgi:hypothetical protein